VHQEKGIWLELDQKNAAERTVGILGFGELGQDAGRKLKGLGFDVALWGRRQRSGTVVVVRKPMEVPP